MKREQTKFMPDSNFKPYLLSTVFPPGVSVVFYLKWE